MRKPSEALARIGGLSNPEKMPCLSWSTPAARCLVGARLARVAASTCALCYAMGGRYVMPNVLAAMERRYSRLMAALDTREGRARWVSDWVSILEWRHQQTARALARGKATPTDDGRVFRWHDSGDVAGPYHFAAVVDIARRVPGVRFWLPTREYKTVRDYLALWGGDSLPPNLCVRLSVPMRNAGPPPMVAALVAASDQVTLSGVHDTPGQLPAGAVECKAANHERAKYDRRRGKYRPVGGYCSGVVGGRVRSGRMVGGQSVECRACWGADFVSYPLH